MAVAKKSSRYNAPGATYGNTAYALEYAGSTALPRERGGAEVLRPRPRTRERALARPVVRVREAGHVSIFAVVGFLAVGVFSALVLLSYVQLTVITDNTAALNTQLAQLEAEHSKLLSQYELAYDLNAIETQVTANGSMVKPDPSQIFTLDLSEPDSVVHYSQIATAQETGDLWSALTGLWSRIMAYFQGGPA